MLPGLSSVLYNSSIDQSVRIWLLPDVSCHGADVDHIDPGNKSQEPVVAVRDNV